MTTSAVVVACILLALLCLLTFATSASAEEPSPESAEAIREQARAAAVRAQEAVRATQWTLNVRWLLWSKETVMVAEAPRLRVLWPLLQAHENTNGLLRKQGAGLRGGEKCASGGRQDAWLYGK